MLRALLILSFTLALSGCAHARHAATVWNPQRLRDQPARRPVNLALGRNAEQSQISEYFAYRTTWPDVDNGYTLERTSSYFETIFDDQSFFDRLGGGHYRVGDSFRTLVTVR